MPQARDYLMVRYIGSVSNNTITSMHGDEEAQENLRQICIREEQPDRYWDYVSCYMIEGKSIECLKSSSVDESKLNACMNDSSRGLAYAQKDFDLADKFNIYGLTHANFEQQDSQRVRLRHENDQCSQPRGPERAALLRLQQRAILLRSAARQSQGKNHVPGQQRQLALERSRPRGRSYP